MGNFFSKQSFTSHAFVRLDCSYASQMADAANNHSIRTPWPQKKGHLPAESTSGGTCSVAQFQNLISGLLSLEYTDTEKTVGSLTPLQLPCITCTAHVLFWCLPWALQRFLFPCIGVYVCTIVVLSPLGVCQVWGRILKPTLGSLQDSNSRR